MPEYNFGINAPLKNAIDYLHHEWQDKPVGFVSYGGISAGTRAVQMTKQIVSSVKMLPVYEAVYIPFVAGQIADGRFTPSDTTQQAATALLDELVRVEAALRPLRRRSARIGLGQRGRVDAELGAHRRDVALGAGEQHRDLIGRDPQRRRQVAQQQAAPAAASAPPARAPWGAAGGR